MSEKSSFNEWALVELFGHQKIVGKVSEASLAGGAFLRVDVPAFNGSPAFTRFYGPGAVYSINPVTEDIARGLMTQYRNEPVSRFELPALDETAITRELASALGVHRSHLHRVVRGERKSPGLLSRFKQFTEGKKS